MTFLRCPKDVLKTSVSAGLENLKFKLLILNKFVHSIYVVFDYEKRRFCFLWSLKLEKHIGITEFSSRKVGVRDHSASSELVDASWACWLCQSPVPGLKWVGKCKLDMLIHCHTWAFSSLYLFSIFYYQVLQVNLFLNFFFKTEFCFRKTMLCWIQNFFKDIVGSFSMFH